MKLAVRSCWICKRTDTQRRLCFEIDTRPSGPVPVLLCQKVTARRMSAVTFYFVLQKNLSLRGMLCGFEYKIFLIRISRQRRNAECFRKLDFLWEKSPSKPYQSVSEPACCWSYALLLGAVSMPYGGNWPENHKNVRDLQKKLALLLFGDYNKIRRGI